MIVDCRVFLFLSVESSLSISSSSSCDYSTVQYSTNFDVDTVHTAMTMRGRRIEEDDVLPHPGTILLIRMTCLLFFFIHTNLLGQIEPVLWVLVACCLLP